jgi:hypothetical protein
MTITGLAEKCESIGSPRDVVCVFLAVDHWSGTVERRKIVHEVIGRRYWLVVVTVLAAFAAPAATPTLGRLVDAVLRNGPNSQLPAHLSAVLGVNPDEHSTAVKQAVIRNGDSVHTFNVCVGNHKDLVMVVTNEKTQLTQAYLLTAAGVLRKAIDYEAGRAPRERLPKEARQDFANEIKFWMHFADTELPVQAPQ